MDMRRVVEEIMGPPSKKGREWWFWPCPFHDDKDPSFGVKVDSAYCFGVGCNWSGDLNWFLHCMKIPTGKAEQYRRHDTSKLVTKKRKGIRLPPLPPSKEWRDFFNERIRFCAKTLWTLGGVAGRVELAKRGISDDVAKRFYVGYNLQWLEAPQFDTHLAAGIVLPTYAEGKLWTVNVRTGGKLKYHQPKGGQPCLFGLEQLRAAPDLQDGPVLVICEGELDALTAASALGDAGDAIALRGAQQSVRDWAHFFNRYDRIILALDGDAAGKEAAFKLESVYPTWKIREPPECADDLGKMAEAGYDVGRFLLNGRVL